MRRQPNDKILSLGEDFRSWPKEWWGTRDIEKACAQDSVALEASMTSTIAPRTGQPASDASAFRLNVPPNPPRNTRRRDPDDSDFQAVQPRR